MPHIEVDDETDGYLEFASSLTGLTKGQLIAQLVAKSRAGGAPETQGKPQAVNIHGDYLGHRTEAHFIPGPGRIDITSGPLAGRSFRTPSEAAREVVKSYNPDVSPHRNGWSFWVVSSTNAPLQTIRNR